jgi:hypothetical protein
MVLKDILAISGEPGLFKFIAQGKNAIIVEHLETKKRSSAFGSAKVSSLEEISIFTETEDMPLGKVFDLIFEKENSGKAPDYKTDPGKLKAWFAEILPEYDRDKVYTSDIKKVAHWYNILQSLNLLVKEDTEKKKEGESSEPETKKPKPIKAKTASTNDSGEVKPKTAPKKKPASPKTKKEE